VAYDFAFLSSTVVCRLQQLTISEHTQVLLQIKASLSDLV
jgi:hypothetical protein